MKTVWLLGLLLALPGCGGAGGAGGGGAQATEVTDYHTPPDDDDGLKDQQLSDKTPPEFDAGLVDRRPLEGWLINASDAVIRLDVPLVKPDQEPELLVLHSSYLAAYSKSSADQRQAILPSVNLVDGKAKQFDDGLYAAIDQGYCEGIDVRLAGHVELIRRLFDQLGPGDKKGSGRSAPFLAAALELADVAVEVSDEPAKRKLLARFRGDESSSKPIGFYTWSPALKKYFQFLRFLQHEFAGDELAVPLELAAALKADEKLLADYRRAVSFYEKLTNPRTCLSLADLADGQVREVRGFDTACEEKQVWHPSVAFFPPSSSREFVLFERLFPQGVPKQADLMKEFVRRIRSGEVDLTPTVNSGWYDHQVFALESLLLPDVGEERNKLLLSKAYQRRMLEAFEALITKRRETHAGHLAKSAAAAKPQVFVQPRLRVEPAPTYYLRTARAYQFLADLLDASLGRVLMAEMHGLREDGPRNKDLWEELNWMRDLFYGFYLVSAEDIGMRAGPFAAEGTAVPLTADEKNTAHAHEGVCYDLALEWLNDIDHDTDLAVDTRVAVPVYVDRRRGATRLWASLGVRLTRLQASYEVPPKMKPVDGDEDWSMPSSLIPSYYIIPVDEFAEVELSGLRVLDREELREVCDRAHTKAAIVRELSGTR
ncbi:MAG TPA: hypothetical protein VHC22_29095 [Pirellulales bacterium]|nr:hypothetical protein [Pirellulales bacterium]